MQKETFSTKTYTYKNVDVFIKIPRVKNVENFESSRHVDDYKNGLHLNECGSVSIFSDCAILIIHVLLEVFLRYLSCNAERKCFQLFSL